MTIEETHLDIQDSLLKISNNFHKTVDSNVVNTAQNAFNVLLLNNPNLILIPSSNIDSLSNNDNGDAFCIPGVGIMDEDNLLDAQTECEKNEEIFIQNRKKYIGDDYIMKSVGINNLYDVQTISKALGISKKVIWYEYSSLDYNWILFTFTLEDQTQLHQDFLILFDEKYGKKRPTVDKELYQMNIKLKQVGFPFNQ